MHHAMRLCHPTADWGTSESPIAPHLSPPRLSPHRQPMLHGGVLPGQVGKELLQREDRQSLRDLKGPKGKALWREEGEGREVREHTQRKNNTKIWDAKNEKKMQFSCMLGVSM